MYLWVERKQIPHLRVMGRNIRFLKSDLLPFRAQFRQAYRGYRETALRDFVLGPRDAVPVELGPTMRALTTTDRLQPRPVVARWLKRASGREPGAPSEEEKAHAAEILSEGPPDAGDADPIYVEAERVLAEAAENFG